MLFEDPEKMKIWDPNVKKTELISYLPSHNSKIFIKESKPTKITGKLTKASLIQYSSDIIKNNYFLVE